MNTPSDVCPDTTREDPRANSVAYLITKGLGYCCEKAFWDLYLNQPSILIAARLGIERNTVALHKRQYRRDEFTCTKASRCFVKKGIVYE